MRLSIQIEGAKGLTWPVWKELVREVEELGFAGLYCCDHFAEPSPPDYDSLEVMMAMAYAASHTTRVELGLLVAPVSWRDPVMLARQGMAIDDLSEGRFILGVGAGWNEREHAMFGYPLGDRPTRIARFTEALEVMTRLVRTDTPQTFSGSFYQLHEAMLLPHPQRPTPMMIGGSGPKRTLPLVAKYGDIWNGGGMNPDEVRERNAALDALVLKEGRQPGDVRRTMMKGIFCGRSEEEYEGRMRGVRRQAGNESAPQAELLAKLRSSKAIVGTPDEVVAELRAYEAAGVEEIMAQFLVVDDFEGIRVLAKDVLPHLS